MYIRDLFANVGKPSQTVHRSEQIVFAKYCMCKLVNSCEHIAVLKFIKLQKHFSELEVEVATHPQNHKTFPPQVNCNIYS